MLCFFHKPNTELDRIQFRLRGLPDTPPSATPRAVDATSSPAHLESRADAAELRALDTAGASEMVQHQHSLAGVVLAHGATEEHGSASAVANSTFADSLRDEGDEEEDGVLSRSSPRTCSHQRLDDQLSAAEDSRARVEQTAQPDSGVKMHADRHADKPTVTAEDSSGTSDKLRGQESSILAAVYELSSLFEPHESGEGCANSSLLGESISICFSPWCVCLCV